MEKERNKAAKEKLGLWRKVAKESKREELRERFNHMKSSTSQTKGKGGVYIHHKGCINIWLVKGFVFQLFLL